MNDMPYIMYEPKDETLYIYKPILVSDFLYYKSKYKHVMVIDLRNKKKW